MRGEEVRTGLRTKARELLAYLLLHPDGAPRETVLDALWPDLPETRARLEAKTAVKSLRGHLRPHPHATRSVVLWAGGRWQVNHDQVDGDVPRFQRALDRAARSSGDAGRTRAALQDAVEACTGELLHGEDLDWAVPVREDLRRRAVDAASRLAQLHEQHGDPDAALACLETAGRWEPYNEELAQRLMRLHAAQGRPDAVRRTFRHLERRLAELDVDPNPVTRQLLGELLRPSHARTHGPRRP